MLKNLLPICQQNLSNSIANLVKREKMFLNTKFPSLAHQKLECSVLSRSNTQSSFGEYLQGLHWRKTIRHITGLNVRVHRYIEAIFFNFPYFKKKNDIIFSG